MSNPAVISTPQKNVGAPYVTLIPPGANPTPVNLLGCQDFGLDISITRKLLTGDTMFAIESADVEGKMALKVKMALIPGGAIAAAFGAAALSNTQNKVIEESGTITAGAVTVSGSANFVMDLGVRDPVTNKPYVCVASLPSAGQYSVSAGVYTFNTGDNTKVVQIRYLQSVASAGLTIAVGNPKQQISTKWAVVAGNYVAGNGGKVLTIRCPAVVLPKLALPSKNTDFTIPELDLDCLDDGTGNVAYISTE